MNELKKAPNSTERYRVAVQASNLRAEAERSGPIDSIMAAGMNKCALGIAFMRLCSEWDSTEKPIAAKKATLETGAWLMQERKRLLAKLRTLPEVRETLVSWSASQPDVSDAAHVVQVILWWLDHVCVSCNGLKYQRIVGTPSLSHKQCWQCHGSGEVPVPQDLENPRYLRGSKKMLQHISACVISAAISQEQKQRKKYQ